jgi:hypothetical protein
MLRLVLGLGLAVTAFGLIRTPCCRPEPPRPPARVLPRGELPREVKGYARTAERAKEEAVQHAAEVLANFLQQQDVPLLDANWKDDEPTLQRLIGYVNSYLKDGEGAAGQDVVMVPNQGPFKEWVLPLRARPDWGAIFSSEQAEQRHVRAHERQQLAAWVVAGLAGLLGFVAGGLRLERWSRERYPLWIRAAVVGVLAVLAAGLLMMA